MPALAPVKLRGISTEPETARTLARRVARERGTGLPGIGRRGADLPGVEGSRRIAELERKIGQLTMENDFLKKALRLFREHPLPFVANGNTGSTSKSAKPRKRRQR